MRDSSCLPEKYGALFDCGVGIMPVLLAVLVMLDGVVGGVSWLEDICGRVDVGGWELGMMGEMAVG